jgi:hypothetical protein
MVNEPKASGWHGEPNQRVPTGSALGQTARPRSCRCLRRGFPFGAIGNSAGPPLACEQEPRAPPREQRVYQRERLWIQTGNAERTRSASSRTPVPRRLGRRARLIRRRAVAGDWAWGDTQLATAHREVFRRLAWPPAHGATPDAVMESEAHSLNVRTFAGSGHTAAISRLLGTHAGDRRSQHLHRRCRARRRIETGSPKPR